MRPFQQIAKLAEAYEIIRDVMQHCNPEYAEDLQDAADVLANVSDCIEEEEYPND